MFGLWDGTYELQTSCSNATTFFKLPILYVYFILFYFSLSYKMIIHELACKLNKDLLYCYYVINLLLLHIYTILFVKWYLRRFN